MKKVLAMPILAKDLEDINIGDIIYLKGRIVTCRDVGHRRVIEQGRDMPVDVRNGAILHAGPIIRKISENSYEMVSVGPTTSMRMEKFEKDFIAKTGVRVVVGKGGMGERTMEGCREYGALHCVFPAGCAVIAATEVEKIEEVHWTDLGMPESLWVCKINEFGPLIVSIDAKGRNLFEENKKVFNERKACEAERLSRIVKFIK